MFVIDKLHPVMFEVASKGFDELRLSRDITLGERKRKHPLEFGAQRGIPNDIDG